MTSLSCAAFASEMKRIGQLRTLGRRLLILGLASSIPAAVTASAQGQGACGKIRTACQEAGFIQGFAGEGVGLQIHCIMPIMQGRSQPLTARRPLPKVDAQLVADCRARNPRFGQGPLPRSAAAQPASPLASITNGNPGFAYGGRQAIPYPSQANPRQDDTLRPPMPMTAERRAALSALPPEDQPEIGPAKSLPPQLQRMVINYQTKEPAGTIVIDTPHTYLYLVLGNGKAMRYGIGVGRDGFTWSGTEKVTKMAEWPDWHPPEEMIERQPYLPRFMAGGEGNPLGARALYLGQTLYRIHGTNQPSTIGQFVSSGCIRLTNDDIVDLYSRVNIGTRIVVLPGTPSGSIQATANPQPIEPAPRPRPKATSAEKPAATSATVVPPRSSPLSAAPVQAPATKGEASNKDTTSAPAAPTATATPPADEMAE
jgi:lipoprotein-anchoring transpeptidase ErfK/SrfK